MSMYKTDTAIKKHHILQCKCVLTLGVCWKTLVGVVWRHHGKKSIIKPGTIEPHPSVLKWDSDILSFNDTSEWIYNIFYHIDLISSSCDINHIQTHSYIQIQLQQYCTSNEQFDHLENTRIGFLAESKMRRSIALSCVNYTATEVISLAKSLESGGEVALSKLQKYTNQYL